MKSGGFKFAREGRECGTAISHHLGDFTVRFPNICFGLYWRGHGLFQIEFNVKIASLGLGAKSAVWFYFYKNFLKSDGAWTCLVQEYGDSSYYTLKIYTNGFLSNSNIRSYGELVQVHCVEGNLYLIATSKDAVTIYLVRNDLSSISSTYYGTKKFNVEETHFNILGQKINFAEYEKLPEYLKKTIPQ